MTSGHDLQGLAIGSAVYTLDGAQLGTVAEIQGQTFRVDVPMAPDYWLRADAIRTIAGGRVTLGVDKDHVADYKTETPPAAR